MFKNDENKDLKGLEIFLEFFPRAFRDQPVVIESVEKTPYAYEITLSNALVNDRQNDDTSATERIKNLFGVETFSVVSLGNQKVKAFLGRLPVRLEYSIDDVIDLVRGQKKWFIGINEQGPQYLDPKTIIHSLTQGSTGFGKSSFFRFLLTQNLVNFPEHGNIIFDIKGTDFNYLEKTPGVMAVAKDQKEIRDNLARLLIEMATRLHYFQHGFESPPQNLAQYQTLREKYKADHLPDFKRIYVWADEFHVLQENSHGDIVFEAAFSTLLTRARSVGIHLMLATPIANQGLSVVNQINQRFFFNLNGSSNYYDTASLSSRMIPHPGRLLIANGRELSAGIQAPNITTEQSVHLKDFLGIAPREEIRFTPVKLPRHLVADFNVVRYISRGASLEQLLATPKPESTRTYGDSGSLFSFTEEYALEPAPQEPVGVETTTSNESPNEVIAEMERLLNEKTQEENQQTTAETKTQKNKKSPKKAKSKGAA